MAKKFAAVFLALLFIVLSVPISVSADGGFSGVVVLDPGHGGSDPGASHGGVNEKDLTLKLATLIRDKLISDGRVQVYMTRTGDSYLSLAERGIFADSVNADILISIHFDSADGYVSQNGVTAYTSVLDKYALVGLGSSVASSVASSVGMNSNGVKRRKDDAGYYWDSDRQWDVKNPALGTLSDYYGIPTWCAKFGIKSMIVEHGFMSNPSDLQKMKVQNCLEKMAAAEASQIISYFTGHTHSYGAKSRDFPSNCMFTGKESSKCTVCGHRADISSLAAAPDNHLWLDESRTEATCGREGYARCICRITQNLNEKGFAVQNHEKTAVLPALSHDYKETGRQDAGHLTDGYIQYTCKNCGNSFKDPIKAEGHKYVFVLKSEPTCTEAGGNLYRCSVCADEYRDGPPALGHKFETVKETPATCTEKGSIEKKCERCSETVEEEIPAAGHKYKVISETKSDCTQGGEKISECEVCGDKKTEKIEKTAHEWCLTGYQAPTCEEGGKAEFKCGACGKVTGGNLPAGGHIMTTVKEKSAGFFSGGEITRICESCGKKDVLKTKADILSAAVIIPICVIILSAAGTAAVVVYYTLLKKKKKAPEREKVPEAVL